MKLHLDYNRGALLLSETPLCFPNMSVKEMENSQLKGMLSSTIKKKSIFFRIDGEIEWDMYSVEAVVTEFNSDICCEAFIHLLPLLEDNAINSVADLKITDVIQRNMKSHGIIKGRSLIIFPCSWGSIKVMYDIKISAPSVQLIYSKT